MTFSLAFSFTVGLFWLGLLPGLGFFLIIASPLFAFVVIRMIWRKLRVIETAGLKRLLVGETTRG